MSSSVAAAADNHGKTSSGAMIVTPPSAIDPDWIGRNQSSGAVDEETVAERERVFRKSVRESVESYQELLDLGMPPEDARFVLPIGTKVNIKPGRAKHTGRLMIDYYSLDYFDRMASLLGLRLED